MSARAPLPGAEDTIAAVATARGRGALAVLRVSGGAARAIGAAVLAPFQWEPGRAYLAVLHAPGEGAMIDRVIVTPYAAPRSMTGEDVLELSTHGGHVVPALALDALLAAGAREALPGEFTRRAVANGKMDLLQAEAVADLVDARSPAMHRAALHQLDGGLTRRVAELRAAVLGLEALLAYDIDFPEEDEGPVPRARVTQRAAVVLGQLDSLLATSHAGEIVREGAVVVLAGPPNGGKSSLFNALLGQARAIVTDLPGTTRDALEALIDLEGWPVRLVDTAGLRDEATEPVERLGIEVAHRYLGRADLVLACAESAAALGAARRAIAALSAAPCVRVRTKIDLVAIGDETTDLLVADSDLLPGGLGAESAVGVSALTGHGLDALARAVAAALTARHPDVGGAEGLLTRARHRRSVARAREEVAAFSEAWTAESLPAPVAAVHLRVAADALEELIGAVEREDVMDLVFRSFCIGK